MEEKHRPDDAKLVEDETVAWINMFQEKVRVFVRECTAVLGSARVILFQNRFLGQAVCRAELKLRDISFDLFQSVAICR